MEYLYHAGQELEKVFNEQPPTQGLIVRVSYGNFMFNDGYWQMLGNPNYKIPSGEDWETMKKKIETSLTLNDQARKLIPRPYFD